MGNLLNGTLFQMCEFGIFDASSRKMWAVMLWKVESLPFLGHASRARTRDKKDKEGQPEKERRVEEISSSRDHGC